jgi:hypothetical protein
MRIEVNENVIWIAFVALFGACLLMAAYEEYVLPQRMAEKGYCHQRLSESDARMVWRPCEKR